MIKRIGFDPAVAMILSAGNLRRPDFAAIREEKLIAEGIARPMTGVPVP